MVVSLVQQGKLTDTDCLNSAGTPSESTFTGQYTQLTADGDGDAVYYW